jgi:hypothetical protein
MEELKEQIKVALECSKKVERSRELSLVITKLEEALLWASSAEIL